MYFGFLIDALSKVLSKVVCDNELNDDEVIVYTGMK